MVQATSNGLMASVRRLADTGVAALQNRLELFAVELREEKARFIELFLWASLALFLGVLAIIVLTATVVLVCPDGARAWVAGGFTLVYALGATGAALSVRSKLKGRAEAFSETISQLNKDRQWLQSLDD